MTTTRLQAEIIKKFASDNWGKPEYQEFFEYHDLGVPLSEMYAFGLCEPNDEGIKEINITFEVLCDELGKKYTGYATVEDFFEPPLP